MQRTDRLTRVPRGKGGIALGLCAGIGRHLGCDPLLVRLVMVMLMLLSVGGLSVPLIYLLFAMFVPVDNEA